MSIFKAVSYHGNTIHFLMNRFNYVFRSGATNPRYVRGFHVGIPEFVEMVFLEKWVHGKNSGKAFNHFILSFNEGTDYRDDELDLFQAAVAVGNCLAYYGRGTYMGVMAMHFDTKNGLLPHAHYLFDDCDSSTGKKLTLDKSGLFHLKEAVSNELVSRGFSEVKTYHAKMKSNYF